MPRNRIIYQSEALYAGPSPATGAQYSSASSGAFTVAQLHRIQSINYQYNIPRRDVNQFGELAAIDRVSLESPTVSADFDYLVNSLANERTLGFTINSGTTDVSCISGILNKTQDERNYFVKTVSEGSDAVGLATTDNTNTFIGIGNGFISSYTTEGSVGNFPRTQVSIEGLNVAFSKSSGIATGIAAGLSGLAGGCAILTPAITPTDGTKINAFAAIPHATSNFAGVTTGTHAVSVLRPGDITFTLQEAGTSTTFADGGLDITDAKIQSYNINLGLGREPLDKLGSKYSFSREIQFPITVSFSLQANVGDLVTGNLADIVTADKSYDLYVNLKHPTTAATQIRYALKGAKLDGQNFSSSIGANKSVTLNFSTQIGGPQQTGVGLFMSGVMTN
jgi:hypothetical protein